MSQSWSRIRKKLEQEFLCETLRGRVQYFFTIYHGAPDEAGRFAVRVDGKEIWKANPFNEGAYDRIAKEIKQAGNIPRRKWDGNRILHDEENRAAEDAAVRAANDIGIASTWDVLGAVEMYMNMDIGEALCSENAMIRMLAILDRRVGKRTLSKMRRQYESGPQWLRQFYLLRLQAEGLTAVLPGPDAGEADK